MSIASVTTLDLAKLKNGAQGGFQLVDQVAGEYPEIARFPAQTIKGNEYDVTTIVEYPTVGFRNLNEGMTPSKPRFESKKAQCHILDALVVVDKVAARAHDKGPEHLQALMSMIYAKAAMKAAGAQLFYGTEASSKGFIGLKKHAADAGMVVNATGTTANEASSVYLVYAANDIGCELIWAYDQVMELSAFIEGFGEDGSGNKFAAYLASLNSQVGLSVPGTGMVSRIYNLTEQSGKGLTDALIAKAIAKHPTGQMPTMIFANRTTRAQLQQSRTVTLQGNGKRGSTGSDEGNIAPIPTEAFGIPIVCTDSLSTTEAIE